MKEKFVMTTFFAAGLTDVATTAVALKSGFSEIGIIGSRMHEVGNPDGMYVYRMAVTAVLIGLYAFSKEHPSRYSFSIDRATRIANIISWGVVALNSIQIVYGSG